MDRVGPPSTLAISEFQKAGMKAVTPHLLSVAERTRVQAVLEALPPLHRAVLMKHLHELAFVDGLPGEGTGLTSPAAGEEQYDITLRATIINEELSTFLTMKEQRVFSASFPQATVSILGTGVDALTYVLLHESSHILDAACSIIKNHFPNTFDNQVWNTEQTMDPLLADELASKTYFRHGPKVSADSATVVYESLARTPFVSLYSTASAREDFAELVAWRVIQQRGGELEIVVNNSRTGVTSRWHPLYFTNVRKRLVLVDQLEQTGAHGCPI